MDLNLQEILNQFAIESTISPYGNGHINDTYLVQQNQYILQRINTDIFQNPQGLMENIERVTAHLREKIKEVGGNPDRETLTVVKTKDGKSCYVHDENNVFRVYRFIEDSLPIETPENNHQLYLAAKGFAKFQKQLADFPAETLFETIKDFHHTPKRFEALKKAIAENKAGRRDSVQAEITFALSQEHWIGAVVDGLADGSVPLRVTHNDTKINNILFDKYTQDALCVIDLDTVMPGAMHYDFGDALRVGASTAAEDETDLEKVSFDISAFEAFSKGYAEELSGELTQQEIALLPLAPKLLTFECGIRFLTDYLEGDTYFKIHREHHNLDRARTQFKLVKSMEEQMEQMRNMIQQLF